MPAAKLPASGNALTSMSDTGGERMIRVLLAAAMFASMGGSAGSAIAQTKQGEASASSDVSSKCAHRRMMAPDPRDNCPRQQGADSIRGVEPIGTSGYGAGRGTGIGPGSAGAQGSGRR
jgi:hypothetical protein